VDSLSSFQQYIQIHGISYRLSAVIFGDDTHFCSIACDPIPEGDVNIFYDGIKRLGRHTTFVPFKGSFKKAKFRIPIFGYCPKSPELEHSSGSGPEFRDP
jgi:hypothetical protein